MLINGLIMNNLTNKRILRRDQGSAVVSNNITNAEADWFENASAGDLHLAYDVPGVVDARNALVDVAFDLDGDSLDTDNAASPYHSNTSEATVGVEE